MVAQQIVLWCLDVASPKAVSGLAAKKKSVPGRGTIGAPWIGKGLVCEHLWGTYFWRLLGNYVAGEEGEVVTEVLGT